jgi:hypothetical protein
MRSWLMVVQQVVLAGSFVRWVGSHDFNIYVDAHLLSASPIIIE